MLFKELNQKILMKCSAQRMAQNLFSVHSPTFSSKNMFFFKFLFNKMSHHFMGNRWGNSGNSVRLYFGGAPKSLQMVIAAMKLKGVYSLEGKL